MKTRYYLLTLVAALLFLSAGLFAQRPMEKLDRGLYAQKISNGIYINWRINADEWYNTYYKIYRDGTLIYTTKTSDASNYLDTSGSITSIYTVSKVKNGVESAQSAQAIVSSTGYIEIPMRDLKSLGKKGYYLNDCTAADLDGDGQYEIIVKRLTDDWSVGCTNYTYFEAYKLDGTFLWAIDVGPNITANVEQDIAAFDFDGDGKAEVFMRTSDNTIFGLDKYNQGGTSVGDRDGDGVTNYRYSIVQSQGMGFMNAGPEYLSLIDGATGKELDWANFIPRGSSSDWGDSYGHRANKFFYGAPFLDGKHPSLFIGRGIYTMTKMQTYEVVNKKLQKKWYWECTSADAKQQGKYDDAAKNYFGQGYHNFTIADVDGDGCDEVNWGSMTVDHDGKPLYSTELGHGDAQHYGDFDPYRKGQEAFACNEDNPGTNLRDAKTGQILYRHVTASDCGRCCVANISDSYKGAEAWGGSVGISATDRSELAHFGVAENYAVYWDGDLLQELCDHSGFSSSTGVGYGSITKFNGYGNISTLLSADGYSCNYSKGTPCLQADLIGDWREEEVWWRPDSLALRIYSTPIATSNKVYTLLADHQYRQAICWQMCGYNQPPHISFYLGNDFPTPIPPKCTNGKLVWLGNTANWDTNTANWADGDDLANMFAGTSTPINYSDGASVLFDTHSTTRNINISATLSPANLSVAGVYNYKLSGTGVLSGNMHLDKMGDSTLVINGNHSYTGSTDIWEGDLWYTGSLSASPVIVRRHANFGGKAQLGSNLSTEFNAGIFVGGAQTADTLQVAGSFTMATGAKLIVDLSDNPTVQTTTSKQGGSAYKNDYLYVGGTLTLASGAIVLINELADSISVGKYLLARAENVSGDLSTVKIQGTSGKAVSLSWDSSTKELYLIVDGTRKAGNIVWTGKTSTTWNIAKTANFTNNGYADIFVTNDSVAFNTSATTRTVNITDSVAPAHVEFNSTLSYTVSGTGAMTGTMDLYKTGTAALYLNNRNNYSGKTLIDKGTLSIAYVPSSTNTGGIGKTIADPSYLIVKDSATLQVTTANEISARGLTVAGASGGVLYNNSALYWNGTITGTKLTKSGTGTLYIGANNSSLSESVIRTGTMKLNSSGATDLGAGVKCTLLGGTLEIYNSTYDYLSFSSNLVVPVGYTSTLIAGARCDHNGTLTGGGTLNWYCDYIRAYINGNWSAYTGTINIYANSANSTTENHFIVNNSAGYPNATISLGSGVVMCYKNSTNDNGTTTIKIGTLTGAGNFYNAGLEVGNNNGTGTFSGIISGVTSVKKIGTGIWTLSGANTYTGTTTVSAGTLTVSGSIAAGTVTVASGATYTLTGTQTGSVILQNGGTVNLSGTIGGLLSNSGTLYGTGKITGNCTLANGSVTSPNATATGTLTFGGTLTMSASSTLDMQVCGGSTTCDKLAVTGTTTCNGTLNVTLLSGTLTSGNSYQILSAGTISGKFTTVNLPTLDSGLSWDTSALYSTGIIKVATNTGLNNPTIQSAVLKNMGTGLYDLAVDNVQGNYQILITDISGHIVVDEQKSGMTSRINICNQPDGIYLLRVIAGDEYSNIIKLIKKSK